jgi:hypothetical protein
MKQTLKIPLSSIECPFHPKVNRGLSQLPIFGNNASLITQFGAAMELWGQCNVPE